MTYLLGCGEREAVMTDATATDVLTVVEASEADLTVVNFWATWCAPCLEEFPAFVRVGKEFDEKVDVLFVSMDFPEERAAALSFVRKQGWEKPTLLKNEPDNAFITALHPDWTGALPATLVYGPGGELLDFWEGDTTYDELHAKVTRYLANEPRS